MLDPGRNFNTTQWTVVFQATSSNSAQAKPALEEFVQRYWQPLYYFARQRGLSEIDAEDATQEFLARTLDGKLLSAADPVKGKFRTFLLSAWKRFLVDQYRKEAQIKSGGQLKRIPIDVASSESGWRSLSVTTFEPDQAFMLAWAQSILEQVKQQIFADYKSRGRSQLATRLWPCLTKPLDAKEYAVLATQLSISASAVKVALHRLRQRYGETLRRIVAETVDDPAEVDRELAELLLALKQA
jgi:RNA polymerase sigma factor (sigma-70 family)